MAMKLLKIMLLSSLAIVVQVVHASQPKAEQIEDKQRVDISYETRSGDGRKKLLFFDNILARPSQLKIDDQFYRDFEAAYKRTHKEDLSKKYPYGYTLEDAVNSFLTSRVIDFIPNKAPLMSGAGAGSGRASGEDELLSLSKELSTEDELILEAPLTLFGPKNSYAQLIDQIMEANDDVAISPEQFIEMMRYLQSRFTLDAQVETDHPNLAKMEYVLARLRQAKPDDGEDPASVTIYGVMTEKNLVEKQKQFTDHDWAY